MDKKSPTLTLKRTVAVKAIVTEDFKKYLAFEVQRALNIANNRMAKIEEEAKRTAAALKGKTNAKGQLDALNQQVENERTQFTRTVAELNRRAEQSKNLELGSVFPQGTVDGWVNVKKGDNLYKKLGGMEIILKDGIIQDILPAGNPADKK